MVEVTNILNGQVAIVTGASRGIGRAISLRLAEGGSDVLVLGTKVDLLHSLVRDIGSRGRRAVAMAGDVADPGVAKDAVHLAERELGAVSVLVNNAGINLRTPTLEMALEDWTRVIDVNLNGTLHFCRAVLPGMAERKGGAIVNVSSTMAKAPHANAAPAYGASKAAVNYLTMHLAREFAPDGVRVNAVCPGPVETDMTAGWDADYRARVIDGVPLGRLGSAEEIAETVAYLASDAAGFITGQTIDVNGGTLMG
jgi:3-oxoacyl-[acyl-carrier protein] reductase